jgi:hypothetical protein
MLRGFRTRWRIVLFRRGSTDHAVHAIVSGTPKEAEFDLDVELDPGAHASLGGRSVALSWKAADHGTRIALPDVPDDRPAVALRLSPTSAVRDR